MSLFFGLNTLISYTVAYYWHAMGRIYSWCYRPIFAPAIACFNRKYCSLAGVCRSEIYTWNAMTKLQKNVNNVIWKHVVGKTPPRTWQIPTQIRNHLYQNRLTINTINNNINTATHTQNYTYVVVNGWKWPHNITHMYDGFLLKLSSLIRTMAN